MESRNSNAMNGPLDDCCLPASTQDRGRGGWLMALPVIGVLLCCGGPLLGTWLVSAGILALMGRVWIGGGQWAFAGACVVALGGAALTLRRRRRSV